MPRLGRCGRPRCLPDLVDELRECSVADACCGALEGLELVEVGAGREDESEDESEDEATEGA